MDCYFGCLERVFKPLQVLSSCIEAVMLLTLISLQQQALQ